MKGSCAIVLGLAFSALTGGCTESDEKAAVYPPRDPIAAGAFFPLSVRDACAGGGKINFCSTESVQSIDAIDVDNPSVADVLRMEDIDEVLRTNQAELVVDARREGSTRVVIDTTFDDGTRRQVQASIGVRQADRVELEHFCAVKEPDAPRLMPAGRELTLTAKLFAGELQLNGEHQKDVVEGDGVVRKPGYLSNNSYAWTPPSHAGETTLTSPIFPRFSEAFTTYEPSQAFIGAVDRLYTHEMQYGTYVAFQVALTVDGKVPCAFPALRLETATPEVCDGEGAATSWLEEQPEFAVSVRALNSGTCRFTLSVEGTDISTPVEAEIAVDPESIPVPEPCEGVVCDAEPTECAAGSELGIRECCVECLELGYPELCEKQRAEWDPFYEAELAKANTCEVDSDCSPVVLVAGCRHYCYVPLNIEQTATFMNTISERYHTSCDACTVGQAPGCPGDGRVHCEDGLCQMGP